MDFTRIYLCWAGESSVFCHRHAPRNIPHPDAFSMQIKLNFCLSFIVALYNKYTHRRASAHSPTYIRNNNRTACNDEKEAIRRSSR